MNSSFAQWLGTWAVQRSIKDNLAASLGVFRGTATLSVGCSCAALDTSHARYLEEGMHYFNGRVTPAQRRLEFAPLVGNAVAVYFSDGRPFYDFDISHMTASRIHMCGDDEYEITIQVISSQLMQEFWRVRGPAKNYDAVTQMRRVNPRSHYTSASLFSTRESN